ncbi:MAG TPA: histidine kinase [Chryseosolibacter sp.]
MQNRLAVEPCPKRNVWIELRDIAMLIAFGFIMTLTGFSCRNCRFPSTEFWILGSFTSLVWVVLWKGNDYLGAYISSKISWIKFPVKRFTIGVISTFAFTLTSIYLLSVLWKAIFHVNISYGVLYSVIITVIISLFLHGRAFLLNWQQSKIDAERLQRENITGKYEALKNQVNPHFLFNSLNALTNLVYEDQDRAVKFIKQLSEVYRYVLDTRDQEIVSLSHEIKFLESYIYLQQIRFEKRLNIEMDMSDRNAFVTPLALQMLIENAIKHNVVSADDPLKIRLYQDNGRVIVENNLQRKSILAEPSAGVGLENIVKRYELLTDKKVEVIDGPDKFIVKLPLLHREQV